ncbi:MAG: ABC transporter ATP-binding protein [Lachnospiraceae bacterium]
MEQGNVILSAKNVEVKFDLRGQTLTAIRGVSLDIYQGETLALVGESGSGKSVFTKTFNGLLDANGRISDGEILYGGMDLAKFRKEKEWLKIRGREIAMIMQEPMTSLNPLKNIGEQIIEAIRIRDKAITYKEAKLEALRYVEDVGIQDAGRRFRQFPHEFSGGMRQRVVIAIALACRPKILICDEPTTALDVTIQAQILKVLKEMKEKYKLTILFITHDLGVVANIADRIAVMYAGDIIEIGTSEEVFFDPKHPYTWALLSSLPQLGIKGEDLFTIQGNPPNLFANITGDAFAPRNPYALQIDYLERPPFFEVTKTHKAKTWLLDPRAPKVDPPAGIIQLQQLEA